MSKRVARLNEQLKREISAVLRTQVRDPRLGVVTVTGVEVAADLAVARVYVRTLGAAEERAETLAGLEAAAPFVRRELGRVLHVRRVPELRFAEDRSMDHARRIEALLSEVEIPPEAPEDGSGSGEPEGAGGEGDDAPSGDDGAA